MFELVPALRAKGLRVEIQNDWVEDIVRLFNDSKIFLYDSTEHWSAAGVTEGFGLPPLEAMACGCIVFSSLNHALSDILTPGEIGHQIGCVSLSNDVSRIIAAVRNPLDWKPPSSKLDVVLRELSEESHVKRWKDTLLEIEQIAPISHGSNFIKQRSRLYIIATKLLNKCRLFLKKISKQLLIVFD